MQVSRAYNNPANKYYWAQQRPIRGVFQLLSSATATMGKAHVLLLALVALQLLVPSIAWPSLRGVCIVLSSKQCVAGPHVD